MWLRWVEMTGPLGLGALAALKLVNDQEPTAELRPAESLQTDESDLMPYHVLNEIEALAIRDKLAPAEVMARLALSFPELEVGSLKVWVKRFFRLWSQNQWKRERFAPSFHYDDRNLDPRSWCRFPILSGGYEVELDELDAQIKL
jgi:NAD+ synthase (glutamine-hydrolysing)